MDQGSLTHEQAILDAIDLCTTPDDPCPARDTPVRDLDQVSLCGTTPMLAALCKGHQGRFRCSSSDTLQGGNACTVQNRSERPSSSPLVLGVSLPSSGDRLDVSSSRMRSTCGSGGGAASTLPAGRRFVGINRRSTVEPGLLFPHCRRMSPERRPINGIGSRTVRGSSADARRTDQAPWVVSPAIRYP